MDLIKELTKSQIKETTPVQIGDTVKRAPSSPRSTAGLRRR